MGVDNLLATACKWYRSIASSARFDSRVQPPLFAFYTMANKLLWHLYGRKRTFLAETPLPLIGSGSGSGRLAARLVESLIERFPQSTFALPRPNSCRLIQLGTLTRLNW
jgi:hypothetical protein